jgi:hypothetical protein
MIDAHMHDAMAQWLLLDRPGAPQTAVILQQSFAQAHQVSLFDGTEWHALREHGPLLIDLRTCPALADACQHDAQQWRGLLLTSEASCATLLAHLRRMLTVSFGLHHRALLSFYNPQTASYFFDACDAAELSRWLGPISQLRWFGGTWADRAIGSQGWQQLLNPRLAVRPLAQEERPQLPAAGKPANLPAGTACLALEPGHWIGLLPLMVVAAGGAGAGFQRAGGAGWLVVAALAVPRCRAPTVVGGKYSTGAIG